MTWCEAVYLRLKVQLSEGTRSPFHVRHPKRMQIPFSMETWRRRCGCSYWLKRSLSFSCTDITGSNSSGFENWVLFSISGDEPTPRFNHLAAVIGNKIIVVGGESATRLLDDVQM
ncbi:uncharacterized protein LOC131636589 isoform X2 [Vicia villosa]|uniref:uncharacterized protein LOC131636589 isoform X2 n=1 Tax=Vicia villosa TaxID=3911 RepID=UPI00273A8003|nr:uncharacterized protein LOC131636589 isoform X2 [Vicia villosa]